MRDLCEYLSLSLSLSLFFSLFLSAHALFPYLSTFAHHSYSSWPGVQKPLDQYGGDCGTGSAASGGGADDDDFDLFGSEVSVLTSHTII